MRLKPKMTHKNTRALWFKRYDDIQTSKNFNGVYKTSDNLYWRFISQDLMFEEIVELPSETQVHDVNGIMAYGTHYFKYENGEWKTTTETENLSKIFASDIGKYQVNKYYLNGTFDYVHKGSIEGSTTQIIKGMIMPLQTMEIQHYNDNVLLSTDDLVVIDGRLYSVENPVVDYKHLPKHFGIYSCTLNSIL